MRRQLVITAMSLACGLIVGELAQANKVNAAMSVAVIGCVASGVVFKRMKS